VAIFSGSVENLNPAAGIFLDIGRHINVHVFIRHGGIQVQQKAGP
jgi:hypothetical protein